MDDKAKIHIVVAVMAGITAIVFPLVVWLVLAGSTYGSLKTQVDGHDKDIQNIKRTLQDPDDPSKGLVPLMNRVGQEVDDLHKNTFGR